MAARLAKAALALEAQRRKEERKRLSDLIGKLLEVDAEGWIPCRVLSRTLRAFLGEVPLKADLAQVIADLGGYVDNRGKTRGWGGVALKENTTAARKHVVDAWEKKLAAEGFRQELPIIKAEWKYAPDPAYSPSLQEAIARLHARRAIYSRVFELACDYLWACDWSQFAPLDREVWEQYALEGYSERELGNLLGISRDRVNVILTRHKARAGIKQ